MPSVLIVDDDEDIRANVEDILGDAGYRTSTASDGPSALALIQTQPYDVVLLDYRMPGMDGLKVYQRIRKLHPQLSVFLVTAFAGDLNHQAVQPSRSKFGRKPEPARLTVIHKPIDAAAMLQLIDNAISEYG